MKTQLLLVSAAAVLGTFAADFSTTPNPASQFNSLEAVQADYFKRFLDAPGFGLSRTVWPEFRQPVQFVSGGTTYQVPPPELIGLDSEPVVYVPRGSALAKKDITETELRKLLRTRSMTEWETNLVAALKAGRDLVATTNRVPAIVNGQLVQRDELRFVGALRAGNDCVDCHNCEPGTLLGAFSYILSPLNPPPAKGTNGVPLVTSLGVGNVRLHSMSP